MKAPSAACGRHPPAAAEEARRGVEDAATYGEREVEARLPLIRPCGATFPHGGRLGDYLFII